MPPKASGRYSRPRMTFILLLPAAPARWCCDRRCAPKHGPPGQRSYDFLGHVVDDIIYKDPKKKLPDPRALANSLENTVFPEDQPYEKFGIYIISSPKTKLKYLYSPDVIRSASNYDSFEKNIHDEYDCYAGQIIMCPLGILEKANGIYQPYNDYPRWSVGCLSPDDWKRWFFFLEYDSNYYNHYSQSDVPPIPGCIAIWQRPDGDFPKSRCGFFYPESILPAFKAIYPSSNIPEENILKGK